MKNPLYRLEIAHFHLHFHSPSLFSTVNMPSHHSLLTFTFRHSARTMSIFSSNPRSWCSSPFLAFSTTTRHDAKPAPNPWDKHWLTDELGEKNKNTITLCTLGTRTKRRSALYANPPAPPSTYTDTNAGEKWTEIKGSARLTWLQRTEAGNSGFTAAKRCFTLILELSFTSAWTHTEHPNAHVFITMWIKATIKVLHRN